MTKRKDLSKNNRVFLLLAISILTFACVIPANTGTNPTILPTKMREILPTIEGVPTVLATEIVGTLDCTIENMSEKSLAVVNAYPDGLRLREEEDGAEIAIIPHKSTVFVLGSGLEWSYVAWLSPNGLICGFSATRYLDT